MKLLSIVVGSSFFVLVLGGCGEEKSEKEWCEERGSGWYWAGKCIDSTKKVQKTPQFLPWCFADFFEKGSSTLTTTQPTCPSNDFLHVACGTVPGSGDPEAYCIDKNDLIVSEASCPENYKLRCQLRE